MFKEMKNKIKAFWADPRGAFEQLSASAMSVVVFTITLALGALVLGTVNNNSNVSGNGNASLAVARGLSGISDLSSWTSIIVIVLVFSVILAMIYGFYRRQ